MEPAHQFKQATNLAAVTKAVEQLESSGITSPSISNVAESLGVSVPTIKILVSCARRSDPTLTWNKLGITTGIITKERKKLAKLVSKYGSKPDRKQHFITKVLSLHAAKRISKQAMYALIYAVMSAEYSYSKVDIPVAKFLNINPHLVSNALHDFKRKNKKTTGILEKINQQLKNGLNLELKESLEQDRYRKFTKSLTHQETLRTSASLFQQVVDLEIVPTQLIEQAELTISELSRLQINKAHVLSATQVKILDQFLVVNAAGTAINVKDILDQVGIKQESFQYAVKGRNRMLGIADRILGALACYSDNARKVTRSALDRLLSGQKLQETEVLVLQKVVADYRNLLLLPNKEQLEVASKIVNMRKSGMQVTIASLSKELECSESPVRFALYGRSGRRGVVEILNQRMQGMPADILKSILAQLVPSNEEILENACALIRNLPEYDSGPVSARKKLLNLIDVIIRENEAWPKLIVTEVRAGKKVDRELQFFEVAQLVSHYLGHNDGDVRQLAKNATAILNSPNQVIIRETNLRRFIYGREQKGVKTPGAISRLNLQFRDSKKYTHKLQSKQLEVLSKQIASSSDSSMALQMLDRFYTRDRLTLLGITHLARLFDASQFSLAERYFIAHLHDYATANPELQFNTVAALDVIIDAYEKSLKLGQPINVTKILLLTTHELGIPKAYTQKLFLAVLDRYANYVKVSALDLVEQLAHIAKSSKEQNNSESMQRIAKSIYNSILGLRFSNLPLPTLSYSTRFDIKALIGLEQKLKNDNDARTNLINARVASFFGAYTVEKVILTYRRYLIKSKSNPQGVDFDELMNCGLAAVYKAAERYDPEARAAAGKTVSNFKTYAIEYICWNTSNLAREQRKVPANQLSLEQTLGHDENYRLVDTLKAKAEDPNACLTSNDHKLDRIERQLVELPIVLQKVIRYRFALVGDFDQELDEKSFARIAKLLFNEGVTEHVLTESRVRQLCDQATVTLKRKVFADSKDLWPDFINNIESRECPDPLIAKVVNRKIQVMEGVFLEEVRLLDGREALAKIIKIEQCDMGETELYIVVEDLINHRIGGQYILTVERGKVISNEKIG